MDKLDGDIVEYHSGAFFREGAGISEEEAQQAKREGVRGAEQALNEAESDTTRVPAGESPYWQAQRRVDQAHEAKAALRERHEREEKAAQREIEEAVAVLRHLKAGTPPEIKERAEKVVRVRYPENVDREDGPRAVQAAIKDLMQGALKLRLEYIGTKHYEGWIGQREDHKYGYGPRHGSIVFAIELQEDVIKRLREGGRLSDDEIEAAVHYLTNLTRAEEQ